MMNVNTYRLPSSCCDLCGKDLDAATNADGKGGAPAKDDITVCIKCGNIMCFTDNNKLRPMTADELKHFKGESFYKVIKRTSQHFSDIFNDTYGFRLSNIHLSM